MSESTPSLYKTVSWLLAILLIGVTALYRWHDGNQREILARKEARIAKSAQLLASAEKKLGQLQETSRILRSEKQELSGELEAADQARQRLQDELKAQELRYTQALAAVQEKERQAYAELEAKHEAANEQNAALRKNIAQIQAARESEQQQLEQRLNEKIDYYRTALEGSAPKRAAQLEGLEQQIRDNRQVIEETNQAMQALREKEANLQEQLAGASGVIAQRDKVLSEKEEKLKSAQAQLAQVKSALAALQQKHDESVARTKETLGKLQHELQQTRQQAAQDLAASRREAEQAVGRVRGLFTDFSKLGGRHRDRGMLLSLAEEELRFGPGKANLPEGELPSLDRIAELLDKYPNLVARIEGHTDNRGRDETNLALAQKRADAVAQALIDRGVDAERLTAQGIGEARPIADNASWAGRSKNRRVEIYVVETSRSQ
jgi:chemotaxis protein MotB